MRSRTWNEIQLDEYNRAVRFFEDNEKSWQKDPDSIAGSLGFKWIFFGNVIEGANNIRLSKKLMHEIYMYNKDYLEKLIEGLKSAIEQEEIKRRETGCPIF